MQKIIKCLWPVLFPVAVTLAVLCLFTVSEGGARQEVHWNHKVYIALGFHGNLYHSFRGDTNDDNGFGRDIRIIRHIIQTLDRFNGRGIPVRASWEFDNHFSLENILPVHAPDIIRDLKRRIGKGKDEVLLMSYNNGLASAMTRLELTRAVEWAISNPWGSGVQDLFGTYTPVVRPQEMMTSPGNFNVYRQAGIEAVALYYSATPFDTFRLFSRPLTREEAHNPLLYQNEITSEEILIIPTYNIGDLVENVSLGEWVATLHKMQRNGQIKRDVLVFINFDADSEYWTGGGRLKWPLNRLPNTRGLEGLIREVEDKNYVRFTTLGEYLAEHGPAGRVGFQQDTADGSFDGYNSWSEKWQSTVFWTRIMAARRMGRAASKVMNLLRHRSLADDVRPLQDEAFRFRLKALSTTHFGMATPFVAPEREAAMEEILDRLDRLNGQIRQMLEKAVQGHLARARLPEIPTGWRLEDTLLVVNPDPEGKDRSRFLSIPLQSEAGGERPDKTPAYRLLNEKGEAYTLLPLPGRTGDRLFYVAEGGTLMDGIWFLCSAQKGEPLSGGPVAVDFSGGAVLKNKTVEAVLDSLGRLKYLNCRGIPMVGSGGMGPYLRYKGGEFRPEKLAIRGVGEGSAPGWAGLEITGKWPGPGSHFLSGGHVSYSMNLVGDLPYVFVSGEVQYPATLKTDRFKSDLPGLARHADLGWEETAPFELCLDGVAGQEDVIRIYKHNFMDQDTAYDLDYHRHSPENLVLDNVNNHITAGYTAVSAGGKGLALSLNPLVSSNFAGIPVRVRMVAQGQRAVSVNPLGTYHGSQNRRPTWGNGQGHEASLISGEQYHSSAPTFNGKTTRFSMMLGFFTKKEMPETLKDDLKAFASPAIVFSMKGQRDANTHSKTQAVHAAYEASIDRGRLTLSWSGPEAAEYVVRMGTTSKEYPHVFRCPTNTLSLDGLSPLKPFRIGEQYYAVIEAVSPKGGIPARSPEIHIKILDSNRISAKPQIPWQFPLKVLWANLKAIFM